MTQCSIGGKAILPDVCATPHQCHNMALEICLGSLISNRGIVDIE